MTDQDDSSKDLTNLSTLEPEATSAAAPSFADPSAPFPLTDDLSAPLTPLEAVSEPEPTLTPEPAPAVTSGMLEQVRDFAERVPIGSPSVETAYPFSVSIRGRLKPEESEKLVDLLNREKMGIREVDLEPQLAAGHILIPRISEFAAVLIVQALRGVEAEIRLGPSDTLFATDETREEELLPNASLVHSETRATGADAGAAETIPLTTLESLPDAPHFAAIDVVTASCILQGRAHGVENTHAYQEALEALKRELKYKAFRKGASAVLNFSTSLVPLSKPGEYRLTVLGSAVRAPRLP